MKYILLFVLCSGCSALAWKDPASAEQMSKIAKYKTCATDYDCRESQHCGFVAVDTYLVCKNGPRGR